MYTGSGNPFFNKCHSEESIKNISISKIEHNIKNGDIFNRLRVIDNSNIKAIKCICVCGNEKIVPAWRLIKLKSCGCYDKSVGYISGTYFAQIKGRAKYSNIDFKITKEYINQLLINQNFRCNLSGLDIKIVKGRSSKETTASLDRIDNTKGYIEGNVQWVHKHINFMKAGHKQEYFLELCKLIVTNGNR